MFKPYAFIKRSKKPIRTNHNQALVCLEIINSFFIFAANSDEFAE